MPIFCLVIDKDHIKKYPYCGSMHYSPEVQSRAINAEDAKHLYRWVVLIVRYNIQKDGKLKKTYATEDWLAGLFTFSISISRKKIIISRQNRQSKRS